jgi:predicted RNA-binding protein (virulence factor B family)
MVQIGKINRLSIKEIQSGAIQLDGGGLGDILLKGSHAARKYRLGDEIDSFVYLDREQRLLATTQKPYAIVGEFTKLTVVGLVAVTDKSPPEDIYDLFGVSKKAFKKAIGALYKKKLIILDTDGIKLSENKST